MKGVTFGDIHTSDFGVYFSSVVIGEAAVKSCCLDIPGASGSLDLTDFFGVVLTKTVNLSLSLPLCREIRRCFRRIRIL